MVERVARGSILAPAAAALGVATLGLGAVLPAHAGPDATLQLRVQVVEACQIRLAPGGQLGELCSWGGGPAPLPSIDPLPSPVMPPFGSPWPSHAELPTSWPSTLPPPGSLGSMLPSASRAPNVDDANRRALGLAQEIAQRVRYVTLTF